MVYCTCRQMNGQCRKTNATPSDIKVKKQNRYISTKEKVVMLRSTGIVRKLDELGRIVLPVELRKRMELSARDSIEIFVEDDKIVLKKYMPCCVFCGNAENVSYFKNKLVCSECRKELTASEN